MISKYRKALLAEMTQCQKSHRLELILVLLGGGGSCRPICSSPPTPFALLTHRKTGRLRPCVSWWSGKSLCPKASLWNVLTGFDRKTLLFHAYTTRGYVAPLQRKWQTSRMQRWINSKGEYVTRIYSWCFSTHSTEFCRSPSASLTKTEK